MGAEVLRRGCMRTFISRGCCEVCGVLVERTLCCCFEGMSGGTWCCTTEMMVAISSVLEKYFEYDQRDR